MKLADEKLSGGSVNKKAFVHADVFERITDAFMALDKNSCYTYINKKASEFSKRGASSLIGKNIWAEFPDSVGRPFYHALTDAMERQKYIYLEDYYPETDMWFENHIYPSPEGVSIYFHYITDKKKMEIALKQSEEKYRLLIEQSRDAIFIVESNQQCPGLDSNQHTLSGTTTSKWLVYQFQHLGKKNMSKEQNEEL